MELTLKSSKINYGAFLWHAVMLGLTKNFMDVDTIIPAMLIRLGANSFHIGLMTTFLLGGLSLLQIIFSPFVHNRERKKPSLLIAINLRVASLFMFSLILLFSGKIASDLSILLIFIIMIVFSISGAFAGVSYVDIFGKSVLQDKRKKFFSIRQVINAAAMFISAFIVKDLLERFDYPGNYSLLLLIAAVFLLIASIGFYFIKEPIVVPEKIKTIGSFIKITVSALKSDRRLLYYIIILNTLGLGIILLPFIVLYSKESIGLSNSLIGNMLIYKTGGLVVSGLILFKYSKKFKYKQLLYVTVFITLLMILLSIFFVSNMIIFPFVFALGGINFTLFSIIRGAMILDITNDGNRALFAGISGLGNILPLILPLISGIIISWFGFYVFFIFISLFISGSIYFIYSIDCNK